MLKKYNFERMPLLEDDDNSISGVLPKNETGEEESENVTPTETTDSDAEGDAEQDLDDEYEDDLDDDLKGEAEPEPRDKVVTGLEKTVEAERKKRQELQRQLDELKSGKTQEPEKPVEVPDAKPKPKYDDFDDPEEYYEALTDWKIDERDRKAAVKASEETAKQAQKQVMSKLETFHSSGREQFEDWDPVTSKRDLPVTEVMRDTMLDIANGKEVLYHLGKNSKLALQIAQMPLHKQAIEISKLGRKLKPAKKTNTSAPDPINPIGSQKGAVRVGINDLASSNPKEFIRRRNAGEI